MSIKLYIGCMFSSKTSKLISEYNKWKNIGRDAVMLNYSDDTRYGSDDYVYSHDLIKVPCIKVKKLCEVDVKILEGIDVILINEGQFFKDLIEFCRYWCDEKGKHVVVCGLDGTFERKPFGDINTLISIADDYEKLKAFCKRCNNGTEGIFTKRLTDNKDTVVIGNDYIPVCRKHFLEL